MKGVLTRQDVATAARQRRQINRERVAVILAYIAYKALLPALTKQVERNRVVVRLAALKGVYAWLARALSHARTKWQIVAAGYRAGSVITTTDWAKLDWEQEMISYDRRKARESVRQRQALDDAMWQRCRPAHRRYRVEDIHNRRSLLRY